MGNIIKGWDIPNKKIEKETSLSDKIRGNGILIAEDVREAVKREKALIDKMMKLEIGFKQFLKERDEIFGDKLT